MLLSAMTTALRRAKASVIACGMIAAWGACTLTTPLDGLSGGRPSSPRHGGSGGEPEEASTGGTGEGGAEQGGGGAGGTGGYDASDYLYGSLTTVSFSTPFILDSSKYQDSAYVGQHADAMQQTPAFGGTYTTASKPIPGADAELTVAFALSSQGTLSIYQQSQASGKLVSPLVLLQFAGNDIAPGTFTLNQDTLLAVFDVDGGQVKCAAAMGFGTFEVTEASNTTAADGGSLALQAQMIELYYPKITPDGDQSALFESVGGVCPVQ